LSPDGLSALPEASKPNIFVSKSVSRPSKPQICWWETAPERSFEGQEGETMQKNSQPVCFFHHLSSV
jgi:hypothetical protein